MSKLPLEGIRVIDFTWVWAGPYCAFLLGMMGAEVIKIETRKRLDVNRYLPPYSYADSAMHAAFVEWQNTGALEGKPFPHGQPGPNQADHWNQLNMNKLGVTLDLGKPEAVEIVRRAVGVSDVIVENYAPRVMKSFGMDYESLVPIRPDLIYISMSGTGAVGPDRDFVLYGGPQVSQSGLASLTGYIGGAAMHLPISYGDPLAALQGAFSVVAALHHRRETGEGQYIDMSQWESTINLLPEAVMEYMMNGRIMPRMGNRHAIMAPHDVFPCRGNNKWIAIAVGSEEEWQALCKTMGDPDWTREEQFADMYSRWHHQDELNRRLGEWTASFEAHELMSLLQNAGVAATPSLNNAEVVTDPHHKERRFFVTVDHPATGPRIQPSSAVRLSETPPRFTRVPMLGEHNQRVFGDLLGMPYGEIGRLVEEKVIF